MNRKTPTRTKLMTEPDAEAIIQKFMQRSGLPKQRAGNELIRLAGRVKKLVPASEGKPA